MIWNPEAWRDDLVELRNRFAALLEQWRERSHRMNGQELGRLFSQIELTMATMAFSMRKLLESGNTAGHVRSRAFAVDRLNCRLSADQWAVLPLVDIEGPEDLSDGRPAETSSLGYKDILDIVTHNILFIPEGRIENEASGTAVPSRVYVTSEKRREHIYGLPLSVWPDMIQLTLDNPTTTHRIEITPGGKTRTQSL